MTPETIAAITTAGGTLVLAIATFSATRSANRASGVAERSLLASLRPVLVHAQLGDPRQKIGFADDHWVHVDGPQAVFDVESDAIYLAFGLRNVGSGIAIIQAWCPYPERLVGTQGTAHSRNSALRPGPCTYRRVAWASGRALSAIRLSRSTPTSRRPRTSGSRSPSTCCTPISTAASGL